jgi:hypothetical protein
MMSYGSTAETPRKLSSCNLTPLQTLSTYRDALKADEFTLRFDIMTFGIICVQVMRIVQVALRDFDVPDGSFLDERASVMAVQTLLDCSNPRDRLYGALGKRPKVWSIIQQIIERVGNLAYIRAEADMGVVNLPRNPKHDRQFAPTPVIFGGPYSPENPDGENSWDLFAGGGVHEYQGSYSELRTERQNLDDKARDEFVQKLITMDWKNDDLEAVACHLGLEYDDEA